MAKLTRGQRFRRAVLREFELTVGERELLEEASRVLDLLERVDDPREARLQRDLLRRLIGALGLTPESEDEVRQKARRAARARWSRVVPSAEEG